MIFGICFVLFHTARAHFNKALTENVNFSGKKCLLRQWQKGAEGYMEGHQQECV